MIRINFFRKKCIGCNVCVEMNSKRWRISRTDGKSNLIGAKVKKENYQLKTDEDDFELTKRIEMSCPVKIIKVEKIKQNIFYNETIKTNNQQQAL